MEFTYALRFEFTATNNEAEYEALIAGLRIAARMGVRNLEANVDSRLVANHVLGEYVAKGKHDSDTIDKDSKSIIQGFDRFTISKCCRNLEEQFHLGDGDIYGDRGAGSTFDLCQQILWNMSRVSYSADKATELPAGSLSQGWFGYCLQDRRYALRQYELI
ncbi:reverse transcriptase domain-containing protein [Tanacetum coccineum]